ncbi:MAG TPA: response regulator [Gemmataceae bacterium]|jgi:PAS domain S-box-containing protein
MNTAPRTILVVDDNDRLADLIGKYLRREGFRTAVASDGATALDRLAATRSAGTPPPDLLLVNLKLPDMTGEQLLRTLDERNQSVPHVVLAEHGDEKRAAEQLRAGALDYLMKDGTLLELLPAVVRRAAEQIDRRKLLQEAEIAYEHLRRHYEMILYAAGEGICGLDLGGRITFVNPAALRMLGYELHELLGADLAALAERPVAGANGRVRDALAANTTFRSHDQVFWRKDGSCFPIEYTSTPIREDGRQIGSVFVFKDVTERRALEEQYRQSQKLEAVGRLAGGVAHDFNNLLTVVSGYSDLLANNSSLDQKAQEAVKEVQGASDRAIAVTRQLLAFSRKQMLHPRPLDLNGVITEINKLIRRLIGEDITLVTHLADGLAPVRADPGQLEQVILNLAVNARDAMPKGGTLTITTGEVKVDVTAAANQPGLRPGRYALLTVADTGHGMDAQTKARIFEPFFTTKESGKGTGLGLATVYGIVVQSGGHIDVSSELNRGTVFRVLWPQAAGPAKPGSAHDLDLSVRGGTETVLLVEDEDAVRGLAAKVLASYGYRVIEARDGAEAEQVGRRGGDYLHLMVTDVVMPGISGLELATRLEPVRPKMKVLFMSGYTDDAIVRRGVLAEDAAFLQKPFTPEVLARKVREVLDTPAADEAAEPDVQAAGRAT